MEIEEIKHDNYETIASIGEGKVEQIRQWRQERIMDVARDSRSPRLIEGLENLCRDSRNSSAREQVQDILGIIRRGGVYFRTAAFSPTGKMVLHTGDGLFTVDSNSLDAARSRPDGVLSNLIRDEQGEVCLDAVAAVRDRGGNHLGFVVLRVRVADRLYPLIRNGPTLKRTMEFFLARREGTQAVFLNDLLHRPASALNLRVPLERADMNVVRAISGSRGEFTGRDYRGREVLADLRPIPDSPWVAVTQVDMEEIMEQVRSRSLFAATVSVVLILLAASTIGWAYRSRQVQETRQLLDAERLQKKSVDQFRLLLDSLHEGFALYEIICDAAGTPVDYRFLWVNAAFEKMTGKKLKDLVGRNVLEAYPETDKSWIERFGKVDQSGKTAYFEEYSRILDKHFRVAAFCPQAGQLVVVFEDISERKRTEDALQESETRFRTTFEQADMGMAHVGLDGRWLRVNQRVCHMLGYTEEELLQKTFMELTHPDDLEEDWQLVQKSLEGGLPTFSRVKRYIRKDQTDFPAHVTASLVSGKSGQPQYFIAIIEDISGRMKTEAQLRLRSAALEASANAMVITNEKGEIEWTNPAFTRFTGYTAEEALGKTPALLKSGSHEPAFYENLWNTIKSGEVWSGEIVNRRKDGSHYTEEMTITPIRGEGGKVSHFIAVKQDITERKLMEENLLRTQRMESLGTLAAGVAHDLNNILTPILLSADLLRKTGDPAMRESMLANIEKSVKRGAGIISQVLTFARGTTGRRIALDVRQLVTEIEKIACETFPPGITVTSFIPAGVGQVSGDPTQLHQVLLNLCINARDAMPGGGILFISAEQVRVDENFAAMVPDAKEGDFVLLSVVDSGEGIPKNIIGKIFDPFFTTKEIGRGTGLGLSTVAGIIRSHGGFIVVESEPGRGAAFKVYLPVSGGGGTKPGHTAEPELPMGNGETILLVEDEANILAVTSTVLANGGYHVLQAAGGVEALETYRKQSGGIALVLTDIMMPKMGGVELARAVRQINPRARVVASTGQATEACEAELRSIGVRVILHKPYSAGKLLSVVHEEIHKKW